MQNKENVKRTLVVNLFAQPGAGKSTGAAYLFYNLKCLVLIVNMSANLPKIKYGKRINQFLKIKIIFLANNLSNYPELMEKLMQLLPIVRYC